MTDRDISPSAAHLKAATSARDSRHRAAEGRAPLALGHSGRAAALASRSARLGYSVARSVDRLGTWVTRVARWLGHRAGKRQGARGGPFGGGAARRTLASAPDTPVAYVLSSDSALDLSRQSVRRSSRHAGTAGWHDEHHSTRQG